MNASSRVPLLLAASLTVLPGTGTTQAWTSAEDAVRAMHQGRCEAAVNAANKGLKQGGTRAYFVGGLMHREGFEPTPVMPEFLVLDAATFAFSKHRFGGRK